MSLFRDATIKHKLRRITMFTSGAALLLACVAFAVYELVSFQGTMVRELTSLADVIGTNSKAALAFKDPRAGKETLAALGADSRIVSAAIYTKEGEVFATYEGRGPRESFVSPSQEEGSSFSWVGRIIVSRPIVLDNEKIGSISIRADLQQVYARLKRYVMIAGAVLLASSLVALLLSSRLQRVISGPILHLVQTAETVSNKRDYSVRAVKSTEDELGLLVETFNEMLGQIQQRDVALLEAHDVLEERVKERTKELRLEVTQRARAEDGLARRTAQLNALRAATVEITRELDMMSLLKMVAQRSAELVEARSCIIYLWDAENQVLSAEAWFGFGEWVKGVRLRLGEEVAGAVAQRREGVVVGEFRTSPYASPLLLEHTRFTAMIAEPLLYHGRLVGVLMVTNEETAKHFVEQDRELLGLFAMQAAISIENARLHSSLSESRRKIEHLYAVGVAIQEQMTLRERLDLVLDAARNVLGFDRINVLLPDREQKVLRAVASVGVEEPLEQIHVPLGPEGGGIAKAFAERREVVWHGDGPVPAAWRLAPPYSEIAAFRSKAFVNLPLIVRGTAIGVLGADNKYSKRSIGVETIHLLKTFAAQAALAIDNARLYDEVTGYAKELEQRVEERTKALQETQVQLIQSGKLAAVGTLAAGVAHELNQPLMVIRGYAQELLADPRVADEEAREDLRRIEAQTTRMAAIVNHLRDFSRQSKGKREVTDLNQVATRAFAFLGQQLKARNIEVIQALDPALPKVWADPLQIEQVLLNLVTNARDAIDASGRGTLTVRTEALHDARVALSVTDTGPGIPPDLQGRIFDPFFTTKEVGKGTGLGLSICIGIVEEHGGELRVDSPVAEGRGARFTIVLPGSLRDSDEGGRT
jgi:signal transduction histidine kinase/putative methionine-R-sulfoxide reductase with GAF domain